MVMESDARWEFSYTVRKPPEGESAKLTPKEIELRLRKDVEANPANPIQPLWELAQFYKLTGNHDRAVTTLRELVALLPDLETKANCIFTMGQSAEKVGDFAGAIRYYKEAMVMEPAHTFTWYFILNNLGYSNNQLGQFDEGEKYCQLALKVSTQRPNAFKNLGLALEGQGRYREAGQCYVRATQANAADFRSFVHLREMIKRHPELEFEFQKDLGNCEKAVQVAAEANQRAQNQKPNPPT